MTIIYVNIMLKSGSWNSETKIEMTKKYVQYKFLDTLVFNANNHCEFCWLRNKKSIIFLDIILKKKMVISFK